MNDLDITIRLTYLFLEKATIFRDYWCNFANGFEEGNNDVLLYNNVHSLQLALKSRLF